MISPIHGAVTLHIARVVFELPLPPPPVCVPWPSLADVVMPKGAIALYAARIAPRKPGAVG